MKVTIREIKTPLGTIKQKGKYVFGFFFPVFEKKKSARKYCQRCYYGCDFKGDTCFYRSKINSYTGEMGEYETKPERNPDGKCIHFKDRDYHWDDNYEKDNQSLCVGDF